MIPLEVTRIRTRRKKRRRRTTTTTRKWPSVWAFGNLGFCAFEHLGI